MSENVSDPERSAQVGRQAKKPGLQNDAAMAAVGDMAGISPEHWPYPVFQQPDGQAGYGYLYAERAEPKIVRPLVRANDLADKIYSGVHQLTHMPRYERFHEFNLNDAKEAARRAIAMLEKDRRKRLLPQRIERFRYEGESNYAYHKVAYPVGLTAGQNRWDECPTWAKILCTDQNREAVVAFFGAFFLRERKIQQALYLYSGGRSGKGSMISALKRGFGGGVVGDFIPSNKRFAGSYLQGKGAVFVDESSGRFTTSEFFKRITGEREWVEVEVKGQAERVVIDANIKFFIFSNEAPDISSDAADKRRLIPYSVPAGDPNIQDSTIPDRLFDELPAFIATASAAYKSLARGGHIPVDWTGLDVHASEAHDVEIYEDFFEAHKIVPVKESSHERVESEAERRGVGPGVWLERRELRREWGAFARAQCDRRDIRKTYASLLGWLEREYGVREYRPGTRCDSRKRRYRGVAFENTWRELRLERVTRGLEIVHDES